MSESGKVAKGNLLAIPLSDWSKSQFEMVYIKSTLAKNLKEHLTMGFYAYSSILNENRGLSER